VFAGYLVNGSYFPNKELASKVPGEPQMLYTFKKLEYVEPATEENPQLELFDDLQP